jgi:O-antigen/teichoic acid export membrane protein
MNLLPSRGHRASSVTTVSSAGKYLTEKACALLGQSLFANAGYLMGIYLVASLTGFAFWGLAARLHRPEDVGIASAVISAVLLIAGIADLGMGAGLVRFLPEAPTPRRLLNTAFTLNTAAALLFGGVFLVGLSFWSPSLIVLRKNGLVAVGFLVFVIFTTVGAAVRMAFVARRQVLYGFISACVANGGRLVLVFLLASLGAQGLTAAWALAIALALAFSFGFLPRVEPGYSLRPSFNWADWAAVVPFSMGNYVASLLTQTSQRILPLIILAMLGPASSAHAYVAWMLGGFLASPGTTLASSAFAEGSNSPYRLKAILSKAVAVGIALTMLVALFVGFAAPWLLQLFGPSYAREATGLLRWLALAAPFAVLSQLYFTYLRVEKRMGRVIVLSGIVAAATLGTAFLLTPRIGIGAAGMGWLAANVFVTAMALSNAPRRAVVNDIVALYGKLPLRLDDATVSRVEPD